MAIFHIKNSDIFQISAPNIDCGYSLEPPHRGGSNEYPQSMFLSRNNKNNVYPCKPQFYSIKVGFKASKLYRHVFVMFSYYLNSATSGEGSVLLTGSVSIVSPRRSTSRLSTLCFADACDIERDKTVMVWGGIFFFF